MVNFINNLSFFSQQVILLLVVLLIKWVVNKTSTLNIFSFFRFYCRQLANKVNKSDNSPQQQSISGWLALLITYTTIIIIIWLFEDFIEVVWLWHGLLLFFSLDGLELSSKGRKIAQDIVANRKYQAKTILSTYTLRDCSSLSTMGLCKAFIEMQVLKNNQLIIVPSILFLLLGPYLAFSYRLLLEMHYCWNIKVKKFMYFGQAAANLVNILQWLPTRLFSVFILLFSITNNFFLHWHLLKGHFWRLNQDGLLHVFALTQKITLAGVAIYDGEKLRKPAFNQTATTPEPRHIIEAGQLLNKFSLWLVSLLIMLMLLVESVS